MAGTTDDEALLLRRTERLALSQTEIGVTLRASAAPVTTLDVDPSDLPRITLDTRGDAPIPLEGVHRPDLAIQSTLGEGGMGRVHLARQRSLARDVAVKTLKADATPAVAHALLREARVTGMLEHPGVIPVHALGVDEQGRPMLVMKRVDGTDLSTRLAARPQSGEELVTYLEALMQVCRTCEFAHSRGVLHRDIKPENIMLGGFGEVYLLDWGIATKLEATSRTDEPIVGTPVYMAPEMVLGRGLDARTDVYLVGATLHEVLTGMPRHAGANLSQVARAAMLSEPFAYGPDVPEELARLCNRATARDPAKRPESAAALREEIALFLRHRAARAIADAARERVGALEESLGGAKDAPREIARAYRLLAEARFGLGQSLEQDPENGETRAAMIRCERAGIELELRQGHLDTAEALYRELGETDAAIKARIVEGRAREQAKAKDHERLARIERDLDPSEHARRRTAPLVMVAVMLASIGVYLTLFSPSITPRSMLVAAGLSFTFVAGGAAVLWRNVLTNAFNRRSAMLLVLAIAAITADRVLGVLVDRATRETLANDLIILIVVVLSAVISLVRVVWPCAVILVIGLVLLYVFPAYAPHVFTASTFLNVIVGTLIMARVRPQRS